MHAFIEKHKIHWLDRNFLRSVIFAMALLLISLFINYKAELYATEKAINAVNDIILDNIPTLDVSGIFIYGAILFGIFVAIVLLYKPAAIPFTLKSIALFTFTRSIFIMFTHMGLIPDQIHVVQENIIQSFIFGGGYFFSGHAGLPFLMTLIFWKNRILRGIFLATSVIFSFTVLVGHLHYSIDVFAAFFITYGVYHAAEIFFKKDKNALLSEIR